MKNDFIDVIIHQEGERTILKLLEEYSENGSDINYEEVPNISWIDKNQAYQNNKNLPRLEF